MVALPPKKRRELGDFLRAHRARLSPASLGLPTLGRRRTPGLRREEVAQACGMSPTWYTWLEQGRDIAASPPALSALARALQLTPAERAYLFELADRRDPNLSGRPGEEGMDVPPALARAISAIDGPAYLLDSLWNARAWNRPAAGLFVGWLDGALDGTGDRNLLRYVFLSPVARKIIPDWQARARRVLAEFRADSSRHLEDAALQTLVEDLRRFCEARADYLMDKELYLLRNLTRGKGVGFFEAGNFYPDFILWLLAGERQYVTFIDPKGIRNLAEKTDPKIEFHRTIKEVERRLGDPNVILNSFIVSNTPYAAVRFRMKDKDEFTGYHVLFQQEDRATYVETMLGMITDEAEDVADG